MDTHFGPTFNFGLMKLETDGQGAVALWSGFDSSSSQYRMYAAEFDGSNWLPTAVVSTNEDVFAGYNASLGQANYALAYASGQAVAAWIEWTNPPRIVSSILTNGIWSTPSILSNSQANNLGNPTAAIAGSTAVVSWVQSADNRSRLMSRRWRQTWAVLDEVADLSSADTLGSPLNVATNHSGHVLLSWIDDGINASTFDGEEWSVSTRVASHGTKGGTASALTEGLGILAWERPRVDAPSDIYASVVRDGLWDTPQRIGKCNALQRVKPRVSAEENRVVVVWNDESDTSDGALAPCGAGLKDGEWSAINLLAPPSTSLDLPVVTLSAGVAVSAWGVSRGEPTYSCSAGEDDWAEMMVVPSGAPPQELGTRVLTMGLSPDASKGLLFYSRHVPEPSQTQLWMSRWE